MKKGLLILCFIMIFTDAFSQRIPFGFWNRGSRDTVVLTTPVLKSPENGATDVDQIPTLDWDGVIYATHYVVQLSPDTGFSTITWEHDTTSSRAGVSLGLARGTQWYWRVLAYNMIDTSDWSAAWSFTVTTGPALTAPVLKLPVDGATGTLQSPTLVWDAVINADYYKVELSNSTDFASPYWIVSTENTSEAIDSVLDYSSTWYWRSTAYNDFDTSEASDTFSFTVISSPITAPTLLQPTNGATGQTQSPYLIWSRVDSAGFYSVQISQSEMFTEIPWSANTFDTVQQITAGLLEGTKWYWRVRSINSDTSAWSSVFSFAVTEGTPTARAYYIDATNGKDEYNGRATDQAWKTLANINLRTLIPGDTVLLKGGETFTGGIKQSFTHDDTLNPVIFNKYGTGEAIIALGVNDSFGINIEYTAHINLEIRNIKIKGIYNPVTQTGGSNYQIGIYVWNFTHITPIDSNKTAQVNISNCDISNIKTRGIQITPSDFGKTVVCHIDSNYIYDIGDGGISMNYNWHSNSRIYNNTIHDIYGLTTKDYVYPIALSLCKKVTISRNLIYNVGENTIISGLGIVAGTSKNITIEYNEIYSIFSNTGTDAEAIDLENGTDSSLVQYNYIHDVQGIGIMVSAGNAFDFLSGANGTINLKMYYDQRGSLDSNSSDYNVVRYNLIKNFSNENVSSFMGIIMEAGRKTPLIPAKNNQVYNNTIIKTSQNTGGAYGIVFKGTNDSTKIFNNIIVGDSLRYSFLVDTLANKTHAYVNNNIIWDREKAFLSFYYSNPVNTEYTSLNTWNTATGFEATKLNYNPLLNEPYNQTGDTLNDPWQIESLGKYIPIDGSLAMRNGISLPIYTKDSAETDMRGISIAGKIPIGAFTDTVISPYPYIAEAKRWIGRHDTLQSSQLMKIKDSLITFLKEDTLYSKMDIMYIFANLNRTSAKLNVLKDTFNITSVNTPGFTSQQGFSGNGTTSYLNTTWRPFNDAVLYQLNNAHISGYSMTNLSENGSLFGVVNTPTLNGIDLVPNNGADKIVTQINDDTSKNSTSNISTKGLFTLSRTGTNTYYIFKNDSLYNTLTTTSSGLASNQPVYVLARNGNGTAQKYTTRQMSYLSAGQSLTPHNVYRLTDNIEWYLNSIGIAKTPIKILPVYPANGDTAVSLTATLRWEKLNNSTSYQIQMSYLPDFISLVGEMTNIDTNAYFIGGSNPGSLGAVTLLNNQIYYWRIRAVNSAGNGAWSDIHSFTTPTTYATESIALFARFPYAISIAKKDLIDSLIKQLKSDTVWSKLDVLYLYAAEDTSNAKINWINSSHNSTIISSPTFTANRGFTGNGTSSYINTNWIPSTDGVNYTKDSSSIFVYSRTNISESKYLYGSGGAGTNISRLIPLSSSILYVRMNGNTDRTKAITNSQGLYSIIRGNSTTFKVYRNDSLQYTPTDTSTGRPTVSMSVLCNNANGVQGGFTSREVSLFAAGGYFSDYTQSIISRRFEWYLNRLGAYVSVPSRPILIIPADTSTGISVIPNFDWDNVGADYYQIEIDDFIAFSTPEYTANLSGSEMTGLGTLDGLLSNNTTYYWRVRGVNANGTGAWSAIYSFTTEP